MAEEDSITEPTSTHSTGKKWVTVLIVLLLLAVIIYFLWRQDAVSAIKKFFPWR